MHQVSSALTVCIMNNRKLWVHTHFQSELMYFSTYINILNTHKVVFIKSARTSVIES